MIPSNKPAIASPNEITPTSDSHVLSAVERAPEASINAKLEASSPCPKSRLPCAASGRTTIGNSANPQKTAIPATNASSARGRGSTRWVAPCTTNPNSNTSAAACASDSVSPARAPSADDKRASFLCTVSKPSKSPAKTNAVDIREPRSLHRALEHAPSQHVNQKRTQRERQRAHPRRAQPPTANRQQRTQLHQHGGHPALGPGGHQSERAHDRQVIPPKRRRAGPEGRHHQRNHECRVPAHGIEPMPRRLRRRTSFSCHPLSVPHDPVFGLVFRVCWVGGRQATTCFAFAASRWRSARARTTQRELPGETGACFRSRSRQAPTRKKRAQLEETTGASPEIRRKRRPGVNVLR